MREEKEKKTPKRRRQNADMRRDISCKNWNKEEKGLEDIEEISADKLVRVSSEEEVKL